LQQSPSELQVCPSATQGAVHTRIPSAFGSQVPMRQHSLAMLQGTEGSRQLPGPRSQRCVVGSQTPEQHGLAEPPGPIIGPTPKPAPASVPQASPVGRHAVGSAAQRPPSQRFEQHPLSRSQAPPTTAQSAPPQTPLLQARLQQSDACSQASWSASQYAPQTTAPLRPRGSQRPLQHVLRDVQGVPGASHALSGRQ
jgi:hypothetical protein